MGTVARWWLGALAVVVCGVLIVAPARGAAARSVAAPATARAAASATAVSPEHWMADEARWIHARPLNGIIIPGSHDTATYGLRDQGSDFFYAGTQDIDLTQALNDGIRFFDLRVKYKDWGGAAGADYWGYHGSYVSQTLRFGQMLDQIARWATAPGHERELILLNLTIDTNGAAFPTRDCENFRRALGSQLLQPSDLARFGVSGLSGPYDATYGQLWSLPGHPHVMSDDARCTGEAWPPADASQGVNNAFGSYYASQCEAGPYFGVYAGNPGVTSQVLGALSVRAKVSVEGGSDGGPNEYVTTHSLRSGFYVSYLQSTTTWQCISLPLHDYTVPATRDTLAAIYDRFLRNADNARNYGNILAGDFVEQTSLVADAIAMNQLWPVLSNTLEVVDGNRQLGVAGQPLARPLQVRVAYDGQPIARHVVVFEITSGNAQFSGGGSLAVAHSDDNGVATAPPLVAGPSAGTVTVTAAVNQGAAPVSFTENVAAATDRALTLVSASPVTATVGELIPAGAFAVRVTNPLGAPAPGEPVRLFPQASDPAAGVFAGSTRPDITPVSTDAAGVARSPALTAGTTAGQAFVVIGPPPHTVPPAAISVPVILGPDRPTAVTPLVGADQSAGIDSAFPERLTATVTDRYGNPVPNTAVELTVTDGAAWVSTPPAAKITVVSDAQGILHPPALVAGPRPGAVTIDAQIRGPAADPVLFRLPVVPGRPAAVTDTGGNRQHAATGHAFAARLVATVTDRDGDRVSAGVPVTFTVVRGHGDFPAARHHAALADGLGRREAARADVPHLSVTVPTDRHGRATAPPLTPDRTGPVRVTASVDGAHRVATWTLRASRVPVLGRG